jgi:hypothetical protein
MGTNGVESGGGPEMLEIDVQRLKRLGDDIRTSAVWLTRPNGVHPKSIAAGTAIHLRDLERDANEVLEVVANIRTSDLFGRGTVFDSDGKEVDLSGDDRLTFLLEAWSSGLENRARDDVFSGRPVEKERMTIDVPDPFETPVSGPTDSPPAPPRKVRRFTWVFTYPIPTQERAPVK